MASFLSFEEFINNEDIKEMDLKEHDLKIIYRLLDQNRFLLCSEHYLPILFYSLIKQTSVSTSLKFKAFLQNNQSIFLNT